MDTTAVVFAAPGQLELKALSLIPPDSPCAFIEVTASGISTGTERLLWTGTMPQFPGMGYPLVPGYETVGHVLSAPKGSGFSGGDFVYVPGANCYGPVRGLFGGAASRIAVDANKLVKLDEKFGDRGTLLALAATAYHAVTLSRLPELVIGHGVLGRLMARIIIALGGEPTVWEASAARRTDDAAYKICAEIEDHRKDYGCIIDASGDTQVLDACMLRLAKRGEIILAGFYSESLHFTFPAAFMREAGIKIAAQWQPQDLEAVLDLVTTDKLSLDGLITHRSAATDATTAYTTAFENSTCLKMVLDWRTLQ
jgi:3-hydroxyethyl bacteriochlorophyllide a dehydrogenase